MYVLVHMLSVKLLIAISMYMYAHNTHTYIHTHMHRVDLLQNEEAPVVAGEIVEGLVDLAFTIWQDNYLEEQAFSHAVQAAKISLVHIIEVKFSSRGSSF